MIQSIERAVALLEVIARHGGAARLAEIAAEAGIGKTTAHNILKTLEALGYAISQTLGGGAGSPGHTLVWAAEILIDGQQT